MHQFLRSVGGLALCLYGAASIAKTAEYQPYHVDYGPLKKIPTAEAQFLKIVKKQNAVPLTRRDYIQKIRILRGVLGTYPQWLDGYWLLASEAFQYGSMIREPKELPKARKIFVEGRKAAARCLKMAPTNPLCKTFLGANIGKISTIDGVFASLRNGKTVLKLWLEVTQSGINYNFRPRISLQGSVRYGLGQFFRLVPDSFVVDWIFGIRGNIDKSVNYHRQALAIDGETPCANVMLAASLLCQSGIESGAPATVEALEILHRVKSQKAPDLNQKVCIEDAGPLHQNPNQACGYTPVGQQDNSEEAFKAHQKKKKGDKAR